MEYMLKFDAWKYSNNDDVVVIADLKIALISLSIM